VICAYPTVPIDFGAPTFFLLRIDFDAPIFFVSLLVVRFSELIPMFELIVICAPPYRTIDFGAPTFFFLLRIDFDEPIFFFLGDLSEYHHKIDMSIHGPHQ
jgi:hypothetical protein